MSRPSLTESAYVQTFVRSPDFRAFISRLSGVHGLRLKKNAQNRKENFLTFLNIASAEKHVRTIFISLDNCFRYLIPTLISQNTVIGAINLNFCFQNTISYKIFKNEKL